LGSAASILAVSVIHRRISDSVSFEATPSSGNRLLPFLSIWWQVAHFSRS
jgi:hypothetical protein